MASYVKHFYLKIHKKIKTFLDWLMSFFSLPSLQQIYLTSEQVNEYEELTYLKSVEINHIFEKFAVLGPGELKMNLFHRFSQAAICQLFPALKHNPFVDRIFRVFSEVDDSSLNFEEFLNLCSILSDKCPLKVKAAWIFLIYDIDGDNQITKMDITYILKRLTSPHSLTFEEIESIYEKVLHDIDLEYTHTINQVEFLHAVTHCPEFGHSFYFRP